MGMYVFREISWRILIARTYWYNNEFITRGNQKMNTDQDADGLFSSALYLYNFLRQRPVQEPVHYVQDGKTMI